MFSFGAAMGLLIVLWVVFGSDRSVGVVDGGLVSLKYDGEGRKGCRSMLAVVGGGISDVKEARYFGEAIKVKQLDFCSNASMSDCLNVGYDVVYYFEVGEGDSFECLRGLADVLYVLIPERGPERYETILFSSNPVRVVLERLSAYSTKQLWAEYCSEDVSVYEDFDSLVGGVRSDDW